MESDRLFRRYWIFDLDGTLTVPAHDFEGMRRTLGLPEGKPILEEIAKLPKAKALRVLEDLHDMEFEVARNAVPQTAAADVVRAGKGVPMRRSWWEIIFLTWWQAERLE